jgi:hypothetical protein
MAPRAVSRRLILIFSVRIRSFLVGTASKVLKIVQISSYADCFEHP